MSCEPSYSYRPSFVPSGQDCVAPTYTRKRARLTVAGVESATTPAPVEGGAASTTVGVSFLFFRSKQQTKDADQISVEITTTTPRQLQVYVEDVLVRTYEIPPPPGSIAAVRQQLDDDPDNLWLEMPPLGVDIYDTRPIEEDGDGITTATLEPFARQNLSGGDGAPTSADGISSIRTGPSRTIFVVSSQEDYTGADALPPTSERIQQWNGSAWIPYSNLVPGECPSEA